MKMRRRNSEKEFEGVQANRSGQGMEKLYI
jgi:hypothetical protein